MERLWLDREVWMRDGGIEGRGGMEGWRDCGGMSSRAVWGDNNSGWSRDDEKEKESGWRDRGGWWGDVRADTISEAAWQHIHTAYILPVIVLLLIAVVVGAVLCCCYMYSITVQWVLFVTCDKKTSRLQCPRRYVPFVSFNERYTAQLYTVHCIKIKACVCGFHLITTVLVVL